MTFRIGILIGLVIGAGIAWMLCRGKQAQTPDDRFDLGGMAERHNQFDREFRLGGKHEQS
jgi:hypothetical protein